MSEHPTYPNHARPPMPPAPPRRRTRSAYVTVLVDLDEFDDDDLIAEVAVRNLHGGDSFKDDCQAMFDAFYIGHPSKAMELARKIAQDVTGRTLP